MRKPHIQNSSVAHYCHFTQTITLKRVEEPHVKAFMAALAGGTPDEDPATVEGAKEILRPMIHELRHWVDMNCSIRGLQTLERVFGVGIALHAGNPFVQSLKRDIGLSHFIEPHKVENGKPYYPWRFNVSISVPMYHEMLEHVSICFYSGLDRKNEKILFKSPLYLGSMIETCAHFQELRETVPLLKGHATWDKSQPMFVHDEMEFIQDPTRPEYHAIAHAFAAAGQQPDAVAAFSLAAGVCTMLLHMPQEMLRESCKRAIYWAEKHKAETLLPELVGICPEAAMIYHLLGLMAKEAEGGPLEFSEDLIFDLFPYWGKERGTFFERSHERFKRDIHKVALIGPNYFRDSVPALIENNRFILEQKSLCPTIMHLPKRPPIICGDGHILPGAPEFAQLVPFYEDFPTAEAEALLNLEKLPEGIVRRIGYR